MESEQKFLWSDAWLLASILWAKRAEGEGPLNKIIAYGDALNHAIFNFDEVESGLARLSAAGLITENNNTFSPAGVAVNWYAEFASAKTTTLDVMDWMSKKLSAERYRPGRDPRNNLRYPGLSKDRFEHAVAGYQLWAQHQLSKK